MLDFHEARSVCLLLLNALKCLWLLWNTKYRFLLAPKSVSWGYRYPNTEKLTLNKRRAAEGLTVFSPLRSIWIPDEKKNSSVWCNFLKWVSKSNSVHQNSPLSRTQWSRGVFFSIAGEMSWKGERFNLGRFVTNTRREHLSDSKIVNIMIREMVYNLKRNTHLLLITQIQSIS